ncbi:hypothetical protein KI387_040755, partial [Taxus chinensis]
VEIPEITNDDIRRVSDLGERGEATIQWENDLVTRGEEIIRESVKRYSHIFEKVETTKALTDKCEAEKLMWTDMLPKMEAIKDLSDDLVVKEGIVSLEFVGNQQEYYEVAKVRVEILKKSVEILDELRDKTMEYIGGLHFMIEKLIGTDNGERIKMENMKNLIRLFRDYALGKPREPRVFSICT